MGNRNEPLLISFLGFPGSGKTTFARQLAPVLGAVTYNSDALRISMFGSIDKIEQIRRQPNQRSRLYEEVFGALNYATAQALSAGHTVIYDAQMTKRRDRVGLRDLADTNRAKFVLVWIKTTPNVAIKRGQSRAAAADSHVYSKDKITMLVERFEKMTDIPGDDETVITIDGEKDFEIQYRDFRRQLDQLFG